MLRAVAVGFGTFFALTALYDPASKTNSGDLFLVICASVILGIAAYN